MKLLVVSHTPHSWSRQQWYGWGPTVCELNFLADRCGSLVHIAPATDEESPMSYELVNDKVRIVRTVNRGGPTFSAKLRVLWDSFSYAWLVGKQIKEADMIHVRCPANISLIALLVLVLYPGKHKWIKYAGDWYREKEFLSYKIQRWLIRRVISNSLVTINSRPRSERNNIFHSYNPSYFESELEEAGKFGTAKVLPASGWNILFVGTLTPNKGPQIVMETFRNLIKKGFDGRLVMVGDGPMRFELEQSADDEEIRGRVKFTGWLTKAELKFYYQSAHFIVLPSLGEGWPKVVSEAMAFGTIPIVSDVSEMRVTLGEFGVGKVSEAYNSKEYASLFEFYFKHPQTWKMESELAIKAARHFSFEGWWEKLMSLFSKRFPDLQINNR